MNSSDDSNRPEGLDALTAALGRGLKLASRVSSWWFLGLFAVGASIVLTVPIIALEIRGSLLGADWAEYLFTGPAYLGRHGPGVFGYPWPLLPALYLPLSLGASTTPLLQAQIASAAGGAVLVVTALAGYLLLRDHTQSHAGAFVGAATIASAPLLEAEIAWGGQAQLLAYTLGLLSLWVIVARTLPRNSSKFALLAGSLLVVAAFSETYATAVLVLTTTTVLLAGLGRSLLRRSGALIFLGFAGPVAGSTTLTLLTDPLVRNGTGNPSLYHYLGSPGVWGFLWQTITFGSPILSGVCIATIIAYAVFRTVSVPASTPQRWLVPASLAASAAVGFGLTPAMVANRVAYPLVLPAAFALAEMVGAGGRIALAVGDCSPVAGRRMRSVRRTTISVLAVASVVIVGIQSGVDVGLYPQTLQYYAFSSTYVSELAFLADQSGAILYDVAPIDHAFVTQWVTGKSIYAGPSFQPYTATTAPEQASVLTAWSLSFGQLWTSVGPYTIDDSEPASSGMAPGVILDTDGFITPTIASDDSLNAVSFSPASNSSEILNASLGNLSGFHRTWQGDSSTSTYQGSGWSVQRTVRVDSADVFQWNYTFQFSTATPHGADIFLTSPVGLTSSGSVLNACGRCSNASVGLAFAENSLPPIRVTYSVNAQTSNASLATAYVPRGAAGVFQLVYALAPSSAVVRTFSLSLALHPDGLAGAIPRTSTEYSAVNSSGIRWAVASWVSDPIVLAHLRNDPLFSVYRLTSNYEIFTVA